MPRLDSKLEAQGAEFLVLGNLLIEGIVAHKTYTNTPGYDLVASNGSKHTSCRIQVKSRWATDSDRGFLIKSLDNDFIVFVALNRGYRYTKTPTLQDTGKQIPEFYVFPTKALARVPRTDGWGKLYLKNVPGADKYLNRWDLIAKFLEKRK